jgi:hypothetical protein
MMIGRSSKTRRVPPHPAAAALALLLAGWMVPVCPASVLSSGGIGYPSALPGARYLGMGGVSRSLADPASTASLNPASLGEIRLSQLNIEYMSENNRFKDASGSSLSPYSNFNGFAFALPLGRGIATAFSLSPDTRADYRLAYPDSLDHETFDKTVETAGGLNRFNASLAFRVGRWADFGVTAHYFFGKLDETWRVLFNGTGFTNTTDLITVRMTGVSATAGCILHPLRALSIGATVRPSFDIDARVERFADPLSSSPVRRSGKLSLPPVWGVGLHGVLPKGWLAAAEYSMEEWGRMTVNGAAAPHLSDAGRLAVGVEWLPGMLPTDGFFKRVSYRAGFWTGRFYMRGADGSPVREIMGTLGAGVPFGSAASRLDVAVGIGKRGSLSENGFEETVARISVSATLAEKWFGLK